MSTQRYAVEYDHEVVGVAVRAPGGFLFISSDRRFDKLDREVFARSRGLARRLGEVCRADKPRVRGESDREAAIAGMNRGTSNSRRRAPSAAQAEVAS